MTKTLTQLISAVQAELLDDGTRFSTATCTAAVRDALTQWNLTCPINAATRIDAVADQKDYELSDETDATNAIDLTDVLWFDDDGDDHKPLKHDKWTEDERIFFRLDCPLAEGKEILARFTLPHTINGLDSETESTLSALYDNILIKGAAGYACDIRSRGRVEQINLEDKVTPNYKELSKELISEYMMQINRIAKKNNMPTSLPDQSAWNDQYQDWDR